MVRIMVEVKCLDTDIEQDLELPAAVPLTELAPWIAEAVGWTEPQQGRYFRYLAKAVPPEIIIPPQQSLAEAGVWRGATVTLRRFQVAWLRSEADTIYPLLYPKMQLGRGTPGQTQADPRLIDLAQEPRGGAVSRRQAEVYFQGDGWMLQALPTAKNQTQLNDKSLPPSTQHPLQPGDWVQVSDVKLQFQTQEGQETGVETR